VRRDERESGGGMGLKALGHIELPQHAGPGGFDHAAVLGGRGLLYVAHTANDAVDVIDTRAGRLVGSIDGLKGVAGVLVDEAHDVVFTSNRGEDSVSIIPPDAAGAGRKVSVGKRPNGLAYDPGRGILLCANVGTPESPESWTLSLVDVRQAAPVGTVAMPGRTRWAVFDADADAFLVNIADPARIVIVDPAAPDRVAGQFEVPALGPHGLDLDRERRRLYCACDDGQLVSLDSRSGGVLGTLGLSGAPDVIFLSASGSRLYVASGDPGTVDVIDVAGWRRSEAIVTEAGAHTIAWEEGPNRLYVFLPRTHRASVHQDEG
jgi:DNA-binding beta-propeller fold protein YncE